MCRGCRKTKSGFQWFSSHSRVQIKLVVEYIAASLDFQPFWESSCWPPSGVWQGTLAGKTAWNWAYIAVEVKENVRDRESFVQFDYLLTMLTDMIASGLPVQRVPRKKKGHEKLPSTFLYSFDITSIPYTPYKTISSLKAELSLNIATWFSRVISAAVSRGSMRSQVYLKNRKYSHNFV